MVVSKIIEYFYKNALHKIKNHILFNGRKNILCKFKLVLKYTKLFIQNETYV